MNTAMADLEYSTDLGETWTAFTEALDEDNDSAVLDVQPSPKVKKIIERRALGTGRVRKRVGRNDYGTIKVMLAYDSPLFALVNAWDEDDEIWLRSTSDDADASNGSRHIFKGYVTEVTPPSTPGDDADEQFDFTLAVDNYAFEEAA
jgi:hypothetical protein